MESEHGPKSVGRYACSSKSAEEAVLLANHRSTEAGFKAGQSSESKTKQQPNKPPVSAPKTLREISEEMMDISRRWRGGMLIELSPSYIRRVENYVRHLDATRLASKTLDQLDGLQIKRWFLGLFDLPKLNVLYVDQDGNIKLEPNKRVLAFGFEANGCFYRMNQQGLRLHDEEDAKWLAKACLEREIELVILDALVRFHRGSETNPADMAVVRQNVQHQTAAGITVLMIHHNSRRGTVRGVVEIIAMADAMVSLKKASKTARRFTPAIEKERTESNISWSHIDIEPIFTDGRTELKGKTYMSSDEDGDDLADAILEYCDGDGHTNLRFERRSEGTPQRSMPPSSDFPTRVA